MVMYMISKRIKGEVKNTVNMQDVVHANTVHVCGITCTIKFVFRE